MARPSTKGTRHSAPTSQIPQSIPVVPTRLSASKAYDNIHDIEAVRKRNDLRLKGRFEAIFEKYGRDFTGVADEVDLETLEVVVDNGHLSGMRNETDIGRGKRGRPAAARGIVSNNNEHDELSSPVKGTVTSAEEAKTPVTLASDIATAVATQDTPFNPYDPASIAELGKNIAIQLAQLFQKTGPPLPQAHPLRSATPQLQSMHILSPPLSERDIPSPNGQKPTQPSSRKRKRTVTDTQAKESTVPFTDTPSIWAGTGSVSPEPFGSSGRALETRSRAESQTQRAESGPVLKRWSDKKDAHLLDLIERQGLTYENASYLLGRTEEAIVVRYALLRKKAGHPSTSEAMLRSTRQPLSAVEASARTLRDRVAPVVSTPRERTASVRNISHVDESLPVTSRSLRSRGAGSSKPDAHRSKNLMEASPAQTASEPAKARPAVIVAVPSKSKRSCRSEATKDAQEIARSDSPVTSIAATAKGVRGRPRSSQASEQESASNLPEPEILAKASASRVHKALRIEPAQQQSVRGEESRRSTGTSSAGSKAWRRSKVAAAVVTSSKIAPASSKGEDLGSDDELG